MKSALHQSTGTARTQVGNLTDDVLAGQQKFMKVDVNNPRKLPVYVSGPMAIYAMYERMVQIYEEEASKD